VSGGSVRDESFGKRLYMRVKTRGQMVGKKLRVRVRAWRVRGRRGPRIERRVGRARQTTERAI
jgi:hypothetical protein